MCMDSETLAERLSRLVEAGRWKQERLAVRVGVSPAAISRWCSGEMEPQASNVAALARALGVTSDYLLGLEDDAGVVERVADERDLREAEETIEQLAVQLAEIKARRKRLEAASRARGNSRKHGQ